MAEVESDTRAAAPSDQVIGRREGRRYVLTLGGDWMTETIGALDAVLAAVDPGDAASVTFQLGGIKGLDTNGAWPVQRTVRDFRARGLKVDLAGLDERYTALFDAVAAVQPCPEAPPPPNPLTAIVIRTGRATVEHAIQARDLLNFLGATTLTLLSALLRPWRIRAPALASHMEQAGLNAMPIVGLLSFLIGVVLAYQGADQLARFGAQIFVVDLVGIGVLREMGILLTAIVVAGRSGSAFTAQIGTMQVNEEVDALSTIGLNPLEVLVLPRVLALVLVMPLLAFYADIMGLLGGAVMAMVQLDISFIQFIRQLNSAVGINTFWVGIVKAPVFAFVIAMVGCYEGLRVTRSAESVGRMTTRAVVESIFLVILLDALFSILFSVLEV
jgi:phospholipid/cholesterol/gamma-HCH transport system permease protein